MSTDLQLRQFHRLLTTIAKVNGVVLKAVTNRQLMQLARDPASLGPGMQWLIEEVKSGACGAISKKLLLGILSPQNKPNRGKYQKNNGTYDNNTYNNNVLVGSTYKTVAMVVALRQAANGKVELAGFCTYNRWNELTRGLSDLHDEGRSGKVAEISMVCTRGEKNRGTGRIMLLFALWDLARKRYRKQYRYNAVALTTAAKNPAGANELVKRYGKLGFVVNNSYHNKSPTTKAMVLVAGNTEGPRFLPSLAQLSELLQSDARLGNVCPLNPRTGHAYCF